MSLFELIALKSGVRFRLPEGEQWYYFDTNNIMYCDDGRAAHITRQMIERCDWEVNCVHAKQDIETFINIKGAEYKCSMCNEEMVIGNFIPKRLATDPENKGTHLIPGGHVTHY